MLLSQETLLPSLRHATACAEHAWHPESSQTVHELAQAAWALTSPGTATIIVTSGKTFAEVTKLIFLPE